MVRLERPLPLQEQTYINNNQARVSATLQQRTVLQEAVQFFKRFWRVICIKFECGFCPQKIARVFTQRIANLHENTEDISYDMSFFSGHQLHIIGEHPPISRRALGIVQKAIFQTQLLYKQEILAHAAMDIEAKLPSPLTPAEIIDINNNAEEIVGAMRSPSQRQSYGVNSLSAQALETLTAANINHFLDLADIPEMRQVRLIADALNMWSTQNERDITALQDILRDVNIMPLLYLYETMNDEKRRLIEPFIVHSYMEELGPDDSNLSPQEMMKQIALEQRIFKKYLERHKRNRVIDNCYTTLLAAIRRAEQTQVAR